MTVKMDFFISPAYSVPPTRTSFLSKLRIMNVSDSVPSVAGSALKLGMSMTVNCGSWAACFAASFSGMNMLRTNMLCHAISVTIRTGSRYAGSAPA